jgi:hypothetical protein
MTVGAYTLNGCLIAAYINIHLIIIDRDTLLPALHPSRHLSLYCPRILFLLAKVSATEGRLISLLCHL